MMNSSCLSSIRVALVAILAVACAQGFYSASLIGYALSAGVVGCVAACWYLVTRASVFLDNASGVCREIKAGNFEARIINKNETGELGELANSINNAIDICDAFVRESMLAMKAASEGRYYRKIRQEGMQGAFIVSVNGINSAIDLLKDKEDANARNARMVDLTMKQIASLVDNASQGNLAERIDASELDGDYKALANQMNGLMQAIQNPLNDSIDILRAFADGDLTRQSTGQYGGMFAEIHESLNSTIFKIREMVSQVQSVAASVVDASTEISSGSLDLSRRTEQQAAELEETAAAIREISETMATNTTSAKEASRLSFDAKGIAESGNGTARDTISAMQSIEGSSQKIADITSTIDEIAFQTNLLALNAAVEAARAGDAGKGFAVVADEVRSLAGRAAVAAKEIKQLIDHSVSEVNNGAQLVNKVGEVFEKITASNGNVANYVEDITKANEDQSARVAEINIAISSMDEAVQQNAALVEENSAACQSLVEQAENLKRMMTFFRIDNSIANDYQDPRMLTNEAA